MAGVSMATDRVTRRARRRKGGVIFGLLALVGLWLVFQFSEIHFLRETADRGRIALRLHVENLKVWLDRYQSLPRIYAKSTEVRAFLKQPDDEGLRQAANQFLVGANLSTGAADTYVLDLEGTALAASNWDDEASFVGGNYSFRPYYGEAMQGRLGRFFALGTVSGKRGYYFSHPVRDGTRIIGVVVVKIGVGEIEEALRAGPHEVLVSDASGVVLFAGNPAWRLKTLRELEPAALAKIGRERQFEPGDLTRLDWRDQKQSVIEVPSVVAVPDRSDRRPRRFLLLSQAMPITGWNAHLLIETGFAQRQVAIVVGFAALGLLAMGLLILVVSERRRRFEDRLAAKEKARTRLEEAVAERTGDLRAANRQLEAEVGERKTAEQELRRAQGELIQAGKLAALGQMSAALSHEFNQPLTAIRTYADNAVAFLERGREEEAQENIERVSKLTERMASLSKHLSSFARKPQDTVRPVSLSAALAETLSLLEGRLEKAGLQLELDLPEAEVWAVGGYVRLQQVIMNLITNAIDAMRAAPAPVLKVSIERSGEEIRLAVEDNGAGIDPDLAERIFDPFVTTKGVGEGLGLGLSISYNIVKDFGGSITAANREGGGARFLVTLRPAEPVQEVAAQ